MIEEKKSDLPELSVPAFKYEQFREVLLRMRALQRYSFCVEAQIDSDVGKLRKDFLRLLEDYLTLEEVTSLYTVSVLMFLVTQEERPRRCDEGLELLNASFNYSDTLKPTMIHYATITMLDSLKLTPCEEEHGYIYMLEAMPHILVACDTGKMIALGLLRAFIGALSNTTLVLHIYRSLWEVYDMVQSISQDTILADWSLCKTYILVKSFALLMSSTAFNSCNLGLRQAGYQGFQMPPIAAEISEWFTALRDKIEEKHTNLSSKSGFKLVRFIDQNILRYLTEESNETTSEAGIETVA
ncbi:uncharacterized protein LOC108155674 isoform X1 [Drosophila miranda]|uniref:uncharacterized protein LOC108155674 isoform X1 n=1 Tax=Drosophila miranda TaxID=7229 RepID=UPI0007E740BF|nr:uncharacterized protein LOC108155674 isoform X1 [Drosophila miranda]